MINTVEKSCISISIKKSILKTVFCILGIAFALLSIFFYTRHYNSLYFSGKVLNIMLNILIPFIITGLFSICFYNLIKNKKSFIKFLWALSLMPVLLCSAGIVLNILSTLAADSPHEFLIKCLLNCLYPLISGIIFPIFWAVKIK